MYIIMYINPIASSKVELGEVDCIRGTVKEQCRTGLQQMLNLFK